MKLIKDLGMRYNNEKNRNFKMGLFLCPHCLTEVEKIKTDGMRSKCCSYDCGNQHRGDASLDTEGVNHKENIIFHQMTSMKWV